MQKLSVEQSIQEINSGKLIIDMRDSAAFVQGFVAGSLHIPQGENTHEWLTAAVEDHAQVLLITHEGREAEAAKLLHSSGLVQVVGVLDKAAWLPLATDLLIDIEAAEFAMDYEYDEFYLLDLRNEKEYEAAHLQHAENLPISEIQTILPDLETNRSYYLYAEKFDRACFAASLFKREGFQKLRVCNEGYEALAATKIPVVKARKKATGELKFSDN